MYFCHMPAEKYKLTFWGLYKTGVRDKGVVMEGKDDCLQYLIDGSLQTSDVLPRNNHAEWIDQV